MEERNFFKALEMMSPEILDSKVEVIERLSLKQGAKPRAGDVKIFFQNWHPFAYACILGILAGKKTPVEGSKEDPINRDKFKYLTIERNGSDILNAIILSIIALQPKEDKCNILSDPQKMNKEISAYANYGLEELQLKLNSQELRDIQDLLMEIKSR